MRLPPEPILLAAKRWLELLPASGGVPRAQALLTSHPAYNDLTPTQYATALAWIRDTGLLDSGDRSMPLAYQILGAIFETNPPLWVRDADTLVQAPEELPTDIVAAGAILGLSAEAVYEQLSASWGKVDAAARERVGSAGEAALVELLRELTDGRVDHVAAWSDGFGYDIAYAGGSVAAHLEVKSTTRVGRLTFYLSRNEYNVMLRDADCWVLVTVRLTADLRIDGVGWVPRDWIMAQVPHDVGPSGSWASCKLEVPAEVIGDGIPHLETVLANPLPSWRIGLPATAAEFACPGDESA